MFRFAKGIYVELEILIKHVHDYLTDRIIVLLKGLRVGVTYANGYASEAMTPCGPPDKTRNTC